MVDETDKIMFTGDNVFALLWLFVPGGVSVADWLPGAEKIYRLSEDYKVYPAHYSTPMEREDIKNIIQCGKELINQTKKNTLLYHIKSYPKKGDVRLFYRTDKVLAKK